MIPSAEVVEMMGIAAMDFAIIDLEHGLIDYHQALSMVRAAQLCGITPIVRVVDGRTRGPILRALDLGAGGVQVPMIESAADAALAVRWARYWPQGQRGLAGVRASGYGLEATGDYIKRANASVMVVAQVETDAGVRRIDEIVATDGIDVVFVGPVDLSQSLGVAGQLDSPQLLEAMERVFAACRVAGMPCGTLTRDVTHGRQQVEAGLQYLCVNPVPVIQHCSQAVRGIRGPSD